MIHDVYRLIVKATETTFHPQKLQQTKGEFAKQTLSTEEPVPSSLIGYWVELSGGDSQVIHRHYVNSLPTNLPHCWPLWGKRKRQKAHYQIEVPALPQATRIHLYEQRINSPAQKAPQREKHFEVTFADMELLEGAHG